MINKGSACLWKTDYFSLNTINYNVNKRVDDCVFLMCANVDESWSEIEEATYPQFSTIFGEIDHRLAFDGLDQDMQVIVEP
jgi:hypothetical protein